MRLIFSEAETSNWLKWTESSIRVTKSLTTVVGEPLEPAEQVDLERVLGSALGLVVVHHHQALAVVLDRRHEPIDGRLRPLPVRTVG